MGHQAMMDTLTWELRSRTEEHACSTWDNSGRLGVRQALPSCLRLRKSASESSRIVGPAAQLGHGIARPALRLALIVMSRAHFCAGRRREAIYERYSRYRLGLASFSWAFLPGYAEDAALRHIAAASQAAGRAPDFCFVTGAMHRHHLLIVLALGLAGYVSFDLFRTLRTGRAHGKFGIITRKQSGRFRRYVYADWIVLAFCVVVIIWILIWPEMFGR